MNSPNLNSYTSYTYSILLLVIIERSSPACHSFTSHTGHGMQTRQNNGIKLQTNRAYKLQPYLYKL